MKFQENEDGLETSLNRLHDEVGRAKSDAADRSEDVEQVRVRLEEFTAEQIRSSGEPRGRDRRHCSARGRRGVRGRTGG